MEKGILMFSTKGFPSQTKNKRLIEIQKQTCLSLKTIAILYDMLKSTDAVLEVYCVSIRFNLDVIQVASFLTKE